VNVVCGEKTKSSPITVAIFVEWHGTPALLQPTVPEAKVSRKSGVEDRTNFTLRKNYTMDIALKKLDLMQRLMLIWDEAALQRVAKVIEKEVPAAIDPDEEITDEEYAQFQEELAQRDRGEIKFHTREESMAEVRRLINGDGG